MSGRIKRFLLILVGAGLILLAVSCGNRPLRQAERLLDVGTLPLEEADPGLAKKTESLLTAVEDFWPDSPKVVFRLVGDDRTSLGWDLISGDEVTPLWAYGKMRERRQILEADSRPYLLIPRNHLPEVYRAVSPLSLVSSGWTDRQWLLWIFREKFRLSTKSDGMDPALGEYLAYRGTVDVLTRLKGPGSLEVRQLKEEIHDKVTGATLVADLAGQVMLLQNRRSEGATFDYETSRKRVYEAWQTDFRQYYSQRFLTNLYQSWGAKTKSDLELFRHDISAARWPIWDAVMAKAGGDLQTFLSLMK
jgi:hypothetical protein